MNKLIVLITIEHTTWYITHCLKIYIDNFAFYTLLEEGGGCNENMGGPETEVKYTILPLKKLICHTIKYRGIFELAVQ